MEVVDEVLGPSHHLGGWDALLAGCAFRPKPPVDENQGEVKLGLMRRFGTSGAPAFKVEEL